MIKPFHSNNHTLYLAMVDARAGRSAATIGQSDLMGWGASRACRDHSTWNSANYHNMFLIIDTSIYRNLSQ